MKGFKMFNKGGLMMVIISFFNLASYSQNTYKKVSLSPFGSWTNARVAVADVDGDNDQDVLIGGVDVNNQPSLRLYIGDGAGSFTLKTTFDFNSSSLDMDFVDLDNDGDQDFMLFYSGYNWHGRVYFNDGNGNFTYIAFNVIEDILNQNYPPRISSIADLTFADINGDSYPDLAFTYSATGGGGLPYGITQICINDGLGAHFTRAYSSEWAGGLAFGDLDNDGDIDLLSSGYRSYYYTLPVFRWINDGYGIFTTGQPPFLKGVQDAIALFDSDNDGDLDALLGGGDGTSDVSYWYRGNIPQLYLNDGTGTFTPDNRSSLTTPDARHLDVEVVDIDNDGFEDLVLYTQNSYDENSIPTLNFYINDKTGKYNYWPQDRIYTDLGSGQVKKIDIDNDGDSDLIVSGQLFKLECCKQPQVEEPKVLSSNLVVPTSTTISWTPGDGDAKILVVREDAPVSFIPSDNIKYARGPIGTSNEYIIYVGTENSSPIPKYEAYIPTLWPGKQYYYALFDYKIATDSRYVNYSTNNYLKGRFTIPPEQPSYGPGKLQITSAGMTWENGSGNGRIVVMHELTAVSMQPTDNNFYKAGSVFGEGDNLGNSNYVVYNGLASNSTYNGLKPGQVYHVAVFEYNVSDDGVYINYKSDNPLVGEFRVLPFEKPKVSAKDLQLVGSRLQWTNGDGNRRLVLASKSDQISALPQDDVHYAASPSFGLGIDLGNGTYAIYNGKGTSVDLANFDVAKAYTYAVFEYNLSPDSVLSRYFTSLYALKTFIITGLEDKPITAMFNISPNPVSDEFRIMSNIPFRFDSSDVDIRIYDMIGRLVQKVTDTDHIDVKGLVPGTYSIVFIGDNVQVLKFIKL